MPAMVEYFIGLGHHLWGRGGTDTLIGLIIDSVQYNVHCPVYCTLYTVQCTFYIVHCAVYNEL